MLLLLTPKRTKRCIKSNSQLAYIECWTAMNILPYSLKIVKVIRLIRCGQYINY